MACDLAAHLKPGSLAILAGLLGKQVRMVLAAHQRAGLVLERRISLDPWATLVLRKRAGRWMRSNSSPTIPLGQPSTTQRRNACRALLPPA